MAAEPGWEEGDAGRSAIDGVRRSEGGFGCQIAADPTRSSSADVLTGQRARDVGRVRQHPQVLCWESPDVATISTAPRHSSYNHSSVTVPSTYVSDVGVGNDRCKI